MASFAIFLALALTMVVGTAPNLNTRVVEVGEWTWPGYAQDLRVDPSPPECSLEALDTRIAACSDGPSTGGDPFGGADPFAEPGAAPSGGGDPFGGADPFAEPGAAPSGGGDPFGGADPFAEAPTTTGGESCAALASLRERCASRHQQYEGILARTSPGVKTFRRLERGISDLARFPYWKHLLVLVVVLGGFVTTVRRMHITLRRPRTALEHRLSEGGQLAAHLALLASCVADWRIQQASTAEIHDPELPLLWIGGLTLLSVANLVHLVRLPADLDGRFRLLRLPMVVPLYVYMLLTGAVWFTFVEGHPSGQAIYLHKFVQHPTIYLFIGLYVWTGMLLSQTRVARLCFHVLTPWRLPPALLAWVVVVLAALPTAYSGASGIFVIAAGAVIFENLREAGASRHMALATTAMAGSLGVVLRPCLVVVLIAVLNKQVTTDELFTKGLWVFALTSALFLAAMLAVNRHPWRIAPPRVAARESLRALGALTPYALMAFGVLFFYAVVMDTRVSEHTAALVLPALLVGLVFYDRVLGPRFEAAAAGEPVERAGERLWPALFEATDESSSHIGALLLLMAGSVGLGGVVERSEAIALLPASLGSPFTAMVVLVLIMVLVGMTMDALGAVVLVSVSVAAVAYDNGIDPVHFWMMVLVAFELGYLTPPVALNHLLARQVIGPEAELDDDAAGLRERVGHVLLPMAVMGTALVLVAFVPLLWY